MTAPVPKKTKSDWFKQFTWIVPGTQDGYMNCKLCNKEVQEKKSSIADHEKSHIRQRNCSKAGDQPSKKTHIIATDNALKKAEIRFATSIAVHAPFLTSDHFGELLQLSVCTEKNFKTHLLILNTTDKLKAIDFLSHVASNPANSEIGKYAMSLLTIPFSNAVVERILSIVGSVKTKAQNRLSVSSLEAVVIVRDFVNFTGKCCLEFAPTDRMLLKFNKKNTTLNNYVIFM
ncbi:MAG: hypothetical protein MHMPM18_003301 [Marteilia pararefringens]